MRHSLRPFSARLPSLAALLLVAAATGTGLAVALTSTDSYVAGRFDAALATSRPGDAAAPRVAGPLVSGSEEYWLTRGRGDGALRSIEPAAWPVAVPGLEVTVGDKITVRSNGAERTLEVVAVSELAEDVTRLEKGSAAPRKQLVTCRDLSRPESGLIRFQIDAPAAAAPARVL